jgi:hypothetical protein
MSCCKICHAQLQMIVSRGSSSSSMLQQEDLCSQAGADFFQDLCGRHQRVKAHVNTSAKYCIWGFINWNRFTSWYKQDVLARTENSENFLSSDQRADRQGDWPRLDSPKMSSARFIKTRTQRRVVLRPLLCVSVPTTCMPCYVTINSIITLGDSRNAVSESEVRCQVVTLEKY